MLAYPAVSDFAAQRHASHVVAGCEAAVQTLEDDESARMLADARAYNARLAGTVAPEDGGDAAGASADSGNPDERDAARPSSPIESGDATAAASAALPGYDQLLDVDGTGVMGTLSVPRMQVTLPIYHGTEEAVLQVGAGHIESTSLPVGGPSTHTVLSGHRGLPSAMLFTRLDAVRVGDRFSISVLGETLVYQVESVSVVLPDDLSVLEIEEGRDLATLLTCTPYGLNTHRLVVRGERVSGAQGEAVAAPTELPGGPGCAAPPLPACAAAAVLAVAAGVLLLVARARRKAR